MPVKILLDWETRSVVDLQRRGLHVYAAHPSTRILCGAWRNLDARHQHGCIRVNHTGNYAPDSVPDWMLDPDLEVWAWNAAFEQHIWNRVATKQFGIPELHPSRFKCLMKLSAQVNMPLALDRATVAAGVRAEKDMAGHRLMLKWCKPLPKNQSILDLPTWARDPEEYEQLCRYAVRDELAELEMYDVLKDTASPFEQKIMEIDQRVNDRGFRIDIEAATGAAKIAREEVLRLNAEMRRLTNGIITTCNQRDRILAFAAERGVDLPNLKAATVRDTIAGDEDDGVEADLTTVAMPPLVRQVLELRAEANKASVSKLDAMVRGVDEDGRFRGGYAYGGAAKTLRFAGRRVQIQNFARDNPPDDVDPETWFDALASGRRENFAELLPSGWTVMDGLKASLRGMIVA